MIRTCQRCVCSTVGSGYIQQRSFAAKPRSRTHYYDVLGVSPKASQSEIKTAYYKLSKVHHPDINKKDVHKGMFAQISEAYETLGNVKRRRLYDSGIYSRNEPSDSEDYTKPFREQQGFGATRGPTPTGRTSQFNFDEFYRQHYNETRRHNRAVRENLKIHEKEHQQDKHLQMLRNIITVLAIVFMCVGILIEHPSQGPKRRPSKD